jgi:hypothetical protein
MVRRVFSLVALVLALVVLSGVPLAADEKNDRNTHVGKFQSASGNEFTMTGTDNKEHRHMLAADAKVFGPEGRECKLSDLKRDQRIRVTTKEGDLRIATKVEALKEK